MRRWLAFGLVGFWSLAASVTACGSDEGPNGALPDGGSPEASPNGDNDGSMPGAVDIVAADLTVYVGSRATVDASQTTATEFAWTVKSAPQGSTVTTQSLTGGTTARPSFVADVSGAYVLELTARTGAESATKSVNVKAVAAPIFYMQTSFTENPPYFEYRTIGTDKSGSRPIACRINGPSNDGGDDDDQGDFLAQGILLADMGLDWWEAPPGNPSRVAFTSMQVFPDGGKDTYLALGTSESTCATAPAIVRHLAEDGGTSDELFVQPRFSPNGTRVAYVEDRLAGRTIGAVSYDGNDRRDIALVCPPGVDSCWAPAVFPPRPQWFDAQTIGWARSNEVDGGTGWEIVLASDSANPNLRVHMTCDGAVPRSIAFLPDGSVIANSAAPGTQIEDLKVLKPASPGGVCQVLRNLTNLGTPRSYARDFAVSPDGTEVVFVRDVEPADSGPPDASSLRFGGELYVVPVNGSSAPAPFGGSPQAALFGGRYVASASQIAWNGLVTPDGGTTDGPDLDGGGAPAVRVGMRDGTRISNIVASNPDAGVFVVGGGNGGACDFNLVCSVTHNRLSTGAPVAMAGVALAFALRRKRRRSC